MLTAISFIVVFSVIVFVHEFGHFIAARMNGIDVKEFSIGMGPRLASYKGKHTTYSFKAFPIGGSVQMEGEEEISDNPNSFGKKAAWRRLTVIAAGPFMNFVFALIVFFILALFTGYQTTKIATLIPDYPAASSGLAIGDQVIAIDEKPIKAWEDLTDAIGTNTENSVVVTVLRNTERLEFSVNVKVDTETGRKMIGIAPQIEKSATKALQASYKSTVGLTKEILRFIPRLITGQESLNNVAGPVGLAKVIGDAASQGIRMLALYTAFISINLGIMNLLPIPALDGGRLIFIAYELIFRRKVDERFEQGLHYAGFMLLMALMVVVLANDVIKLFNPQ